MPYEPDVEALPPEVDDARLLEALAGRDPDISPRLAVEALARRRGPAAVQGLGRLAADRAAPTELRVKATRNLGRLPGQDQQDVLLPLLRDRDPQVVAAAADSLGRIGDIRALAALESLAPIGDEVAGREIRFARILLSYRLGVGSHLVAPPAESDLLAVGTDAAPIEHRDAPDDVAAQAVQDAVRDLPALALRSQRAQLLRCWGTDLLLTPTEHAADATELRGLDQRNAIPAVLLRRWECPERWALSLYLFSQPEPVRGAAALLALRPDGTLVGAGSAPEQDGRRGFRLRSLPSGYFPAVEVDGSYDPDRGFELGRAVSAGTVQRQMRRRTPRRAG